MSGTSKIIFRCEYQDCQYETYRHSAMIIHVRSHTGEKPYECEVCGTCFAASTDLTKHHRIHTKKFVYFCPYEGCRKGFVLSGNLNTHMRTHTGEKPYECEICKQKFRFASLLTVHMRRHTGERPYKCKICEKSFAQQATYSKHIRSLVHKKKEREQEEQMINNINLLADVSIGKTHDP